MKKKTAKATSYDPIEVEMPLPYGLDKDTVLAATKYALTGELALPETGGASQTIHAKAGTVWLDEVSEFGPGDVPSEPKWTLGGEPLGDGWKDVGWLDGDKLDSVMKETKTFAALMKEATKLAAETWLSKAPSKTQEGPHNQQLVTRLADRIPGMQEHLKCPASAEHAAQDVMSLVIHLNDVHRWTREAIADWLDTVDVDLTVQEAPPPYESTFVFRVEKLLHQGSVLVHYCVAGTSSSVVARIPVELLEPTTWTKWLGQFEASLPELVASGNPVWEVCLPDSLELSPGTKFEPITGTGTIYAIGLTRAARPDGFRTGESLAAWIERDRKEAVRFNHLIKITGTAT